MGPSAELDTFHALSNQVGARAVPIATSFPCDATSGHFPIHPDNRSADSDPSEAIRAEGQNVQPEIVQLIVKYVDIGSIKIEFQIAKPNVRRGVRHYVRVSGSPGNQDQKPKTRTARGVLRISVRAPVSTEHFNPNDCS